MGLRTSRKRTTLVLALVIALLPVLGLDGAASAGSSPADSCAPGGEAGDTRATATEVDTPVLCDGALGVGNPQDWYAPLHASPENLAPGDLRMVVSIGAHDGLDVEVCVYRGAARIECARAAPGGSGVVVALVRPSYTQHYVQVNRLDGEGAYTLSVTLSAWTGKLSCAAPGVRAPANACFDHAQEIASPARVTQSMEGASVEAGEPRCGGEAADRSVWFAFTPTETMTYHLLAEDRVHHLGVYVGTRLGDLQEVACARGSAPAPVGWLAEAGTTYRVRVAVQGAAGEFTLHLSDRDDFCRPVERLLGDVPNNCFRDALEVTSPSTGTYLTRGATYQPWEPHRETPQQKGPGSVWFSFTPEGLARYVASTQGSDYAADIVVWRGPNVQDLTLVAHRYPPFYGFQDPVSVGIAHHQVAWIGEPGVTYHLQAVALEPVAWAYASPRLSVPGVVGVEWVAATQKVPAAPDGGELALTVEGGPVPCDEGPPNHCFENAIPITSPVRVAGDNTGAGLQVGEPRCTSAPYAEGEGQFATLWYKYTADEDIVMYLDRSEDPQRGRLNSYLSIFEGSSLEDLTDVGSKQRCNLHPHIPLGWTAKAGTTYWIQLGGRENNHVSPNEGPFTLHLVKANGECASGPPANDCVIDAQDVMVGETVAGSNVGATRQPHESTGAQTCGMNDATIWYRLTPATAGVVTASTAGSGLDTALAVYRHGWASHPMQCNDDDADGTLHSRVAWTAEAGVTYLIQVGGATKAGASGEGDVVLTLT